MSWMDWIPSIIEGVGLIAGKDDAKRPSEVEPLDLDALARLMTMNTQSPWGGMTYTQGDDGRYTASYNLSPQTQPIFDNMASRAMNPDQAYPIPDELNQLQQALMQQRLGSVGMPMQGASPMPERRPYSPGGGGQFSGPFAQPGANPTPGGGQQRTPDPSQGRVREQSPIGSGGIGGGNSGGYTHPGQFGFGSSGNSGGTWADYMKRTAPLQGSDPSAWKQFGIENAGNIGKAVGLATGIPGLGFLGDALADNYWKDNQWQSPAPYDPDFPSANDLINQAFDGPSSPIGGSVREPTGGMGGNASFGNAFSGTNNGLVDMLSQGQGYWNNMFGWLGNVGGTGGKGGLMLPIAISDE